MTKDVKACVPRLRFPEFAGAERWRKTTVNEISSEPLCNGIFNDPAKVGSGYYIINVKDMYLNTAIYDCSLQEIALSEGEFKNKVHNGDIFFTRSSLVPSGIAFSNLYAGYSNNVTFDGHLIRLRVNKEICLPLFVCLLLKTRDVRHYLVSCGKTGAMTTISQEDISKTVLYIPSTVEQQKIADCLSSLDDLIEAHEQKRDALKQHKKGLMQRLFPAEGENTPRWRFPEFRDSGEWTWVKLGQLCSICTGKKDANEGSSSGAYPFFTCSENTIYSDSYSFDCEALLIAGNANVGLTKYYNGKFEAYQRTYVLSKFKNISVVYLCVYLQAMLQDSLRKIVQVSAMQYIKIAMLKDYIVCCPLTIAEQQKIADCLSSIDERIAVEEERIAALREHKKGLIQQLFPCEE